MCQKCIRNMVRLSHQWDAGHFFHHGMSVVVWNQQMKMINLFLKVVGTAVLSHYIYQ